MTSHCQMENEDQAKVLKWRHLVEIKVVLEMRRVMHWSQGLEEDDDGDTGDNDYEPESEELMKRQ